MQNISYFDHYRGKYIVRFEHEGRRCDVAIDIHRDRSGWWVDDTSLRKAKAKCIRQLEEDARERALGEPRNRQERRQGRKPDDPTHRR